MLGGNPAETLGNMPFWLRTAGVAMSNWWQPLIGVVVGWVLGQSTELWSQRRRARRYRQAIYVELMDVHSAVKTRINAMREMLKEFLMHRTMSNILADIRYTIFKAHFA